MFFVILSLVIFGIYSACVCRSRWSGFDELVPREYRRNVPWNGWDVLLLLLLFFLMPALSWNIFGAAERTAVSVMEEKTPPVESWSNEHPLTRLALGQGDRPEIFLLIVFCAVIAAPITEEFFFRLVFQGWLQNHERTFRRGFPLPAGVMPIVPVALSFALLHFRSETSSLPYEELVRRILVASLGGLAAVLSGVLHLVVVRRAGWRDFGIDPAKIGGDFRAGLVVFLFILPPLMMLQQGLISVKESISLKPGWTTDPIPLFLFALALGLLFYRTRRLTASLVLHAALNGTMVLLLFLGSARFG